MNNTTGLTATSLHQTSQECVGGSRCPVCGCTRTSLHLKGDDSLSLESVGSSRTKLSHGRILRCGGCGLCFRIFRPSSKELGDLYRDANDEIYEAEAANRLKTAKAHYQLVKRYHRQPGTIVDVGCASGVFLRLMTDAGWNCFGVEPSISQSKRAQQLLGNRAVLEQRVLEEASLPTGVDLVTLWDVLEHVPDPVDFLARCASLLRPGGFLLLNTPRIDSCIARALGRRWPLLLAEHLNYFTVDSLRMCARKAGLELVKTGTRPVFFSVGYILYRLSQHAVPLAKWAQRISFALHLQNISIPIWMGEIFACCEKRN